MTGSRPSELPDRALVAECHRAKGRRDAGDLHAEALAEMARSLDQERTATAELVASVRALLERLGPGSGYLYGDVTSRVWRALDAMRPIEPLELRDDVIAAGVRAGLLSGDAMRVPDEVCITCQGDAQPCSKACWSGADGDARGVRHVHVRLTPEEWEAAQRRLVEDWPRRGEILARRMA